MLLKAEKVGNPGKKVKTVKESIKLVSNHRCFDTCNGNYSAMHNRRHG
jgi:hypothetical protein